MDTRSIRIAIAVAATLAGLAHAANVAPPPLPIGSTLARPEPGMSEPERKRAVRAHHHKFENGKDYTRDDSIYGPEPMRTSATVPAGAGATGTRPGAGAAPVGGAGTGPAREKTDKGAASYFFGTDKK